MKNSADIYYPIDETEKHFIGNIWRLQEWNMQERTEIILPKGTVEIIFSLADNITYFNPALNYKQTLPSCFINGINFKPFNLIKNGQQLFIGIQLNTIGLKGLFNINVKDFHNVVIEGSQVCIELNALCHQLLSCKNFDGQVTAIRKWLWQKISKSKHNQVIHKVHNLFYSSRENDLTVKSLCKENCVSDRQLRRISAEWLGMNTENFLIYNKYLASLHLLHNSKLSLTQIGLEAGYYDQSHFIREFKSFTDLTPKEYQASNTILPGHIIR
ncbi:MAG: AraC family transcriptional regulator [Bacteroidetes bacterium]|nr:AraC family transcriptional regulator [Bacteroidota bacterium]